MKRWVKGVAQLLAIFGLVLVMRTMLLVDRLARWVVNQKSLAAFVAVSVVPVLFFLTAVFSLWAGYQWGTVALAVVVAVGFIAIVATMATAGQMARAASTERRVP